MPTYFDDIRELKAQAVQRVLMGLPVEYNSHFHGLTPDMAKVNGYSIIWHDGAMSSEDRRAVEVRVPDGDTRVVAINQLHDLVTGKTVERWDGDFAHTLADLIDGNKVSNGFHEFFRVDNISTMKGLNTITVVGNDHEVFYIRVEKEPE